MFAFQKSKVDGFCCLSRVGVARDDLVLASVLILCSTSLPLSSTKGAVGRVGFRPLLGLMGVTSSVETVDVESCLASSFSTSTSSVSLSSALMRVLFRLPRRVSVDEDVFEGDAATAAATAAEVAGVLLVFVSLELFRELGSESSSSLSVSFLVEVRLLCLLSAGDPVREPFDVTEEGVPALELSFGPLEVTTVGLLFVASEGGGTVFSAVTFPFRGVVLPPAPDLGPGFFLSGGFASGVGVLVGPGSTGSVALDSSLIAESASGISLSLLQDKFSLILDLSIHSS